MADPSSGNEASDDAFGASSHGVTSSSSQGGDELSGGGRRGASYQSFQDPSSRVFIFELNQELERLWVFYSGQGNHCAHLLSSLQDDSAAARQRLHRRLCGTVPPQPHSPPPPPGATSPTPGPQAGASAPETDEFVQGVGGSSWHAMDGAGAWSEGDGEGSVHVAGGREEGNNLITMDAEPLLPTGVAATSSARGDSKVEGGVGGARGKISPPTLPTALGQSGGEKLTCGGGGGGGGGATDPMKVEEDPYLRASLKRSLVELYNTCHRLLSFKMLNYDACIRLVKLHCCGMRNGVVGGVPVGVVGVGGSGGVVNGGGGGGVEDNAAGALGVEKAMLMWLLEQPLFSSRDLDRTLGGVELLYASLFCHGNVDVARAALTFKASSSLRGNRRFDFGFRLGAAAVLLAWALWDCIADDSLGKDVWHDPAFKIYRGLGNLVLLVWMWGINIWVWRRYGIDYEKCLSLDPRGPRVDPCEQVWNTGCDLSIAFLLSVICFYKALRGVLINEEMVPSQFAHTFPLLLLLYMGHKLVTPWSQRKALLHVIWTVVISPFGQVRFLEGYVGDILTRCVRHN
ncbi:unnamed protein product [Discosporangium mesarthrocarpum]